MQCWTLVDISKGKDTWRMAAIAVISFFDVTWARRREADPIVLSEGAAPVVADFFTAIFASAALILCDTVCASSVARRT